MVFSKVQVLFFHFAPVWGLEKNEARFVRSSMYLNVTIWKVEKYFFERNFSRLIFNFESYSTQDVVDKNWKKWGYHVFLHKYDYCTWDLVYEHEQKNIFHPTLLCNKVTQAYACFLYWLMILTKHTAIYHHSEYRARQYSSSQLNVYTEYFPEH